VITKYDFLKTFTSKYIHLTELFVYLSTMAQNKFESGAKAGKGGTGPAGNIFWSCPSPFLVLKVQLVVLVSAFVMVSTVWSVSCLLFFYLRCSPPLPRHL